MRKAFTSIFIILILAGLAFSQAPNVSVPYILKAPEPITVDGNLDEWAFAYPLDHNMVSIPDSGRFKAEQPGWVPSTFEDCSGTIYMMYDDEYLYFAASVMDDEPGHWSDAIWASDCIEIYMANYDVGDVLFPEAHPEGGWPNTAEGDYALQLNMSFDESQDTVRIYEFYGVAGVIESENTEMTYQIWPDGDGYYMEGKIYLPDLDSPTTGNFFEFTPGTRIPMTWSLYDIDETEASADFQGFAYTPKGYAGWMGVGPGWQVCDVMENARGFEWEDMATFNFVSPYVKKVADHRPVTVDGDLGDWNFCFPIDHWRSVLPDSGRFVIENPGWLPATDEDCKGTIYMQYDDEYLYFAASVMDDEPGHWSDAIWASDCIEIYMANYDIGDVLLPEPHAEDGWHNTAEGDYALQLNMSFDESQDTVRVYEFYGVAGVIESENTEMVYNIWPFGDGYNMEGKIYLPDLDSPTTGNFFEFVDGYRLAMTWSLYDIDETEASADFQGMAYTPKGFAGWMGVGNGWQYADVKNISLIEYIDVHAATGIENPEPTAVLRTFTLEQNYPNPFNPTTNISFTLDQASKVSLKVYNITGQLVQTVINGESHVAGAHEAKIDMSGMSSGIYFAVLSNGKESLKRKMMLIK
jgi:hypothetical protein